MNDLVLIKDVNYFGRIIHRGSTFKQVTTDSRDWYCLWENNGGVIMHCPSVKLHFTAVTDEFFVEQYAGQPVRQKNNIES